MTRILVIDDDRAMRELLNEVLRDADYELLYVDALEHAAVDAAPDLVITDLVGLRGYDRGRARAIVHRVEERYPGVPVVVCTGYEEAMEESDRLGAGAVVHKPFEIDLLFATVARLATR